MIIKLTKENQIGKDEFSASKKHIKSNCDTHWHEFYEIEYVIDGGGTCIINGENFKMQSGSLFFLTPVDFHTVKTDNATVINIMFSSDSVNSAYLTPFTALNSCKSTVLSADKRIFAETVLSEIVNSQKNTALCTTLTEALLIKLSEDFSTEFYHNTNTLVQKLHFFIINHFKENITLDDIARYAGITPSYASAVFKSQMQIGIKNYLNGLRFDYAKKLLVYSDLTVLQICTDCGFNDYPNFIRHFKSHFGVSPAEYRKLNTNLT